MKRGIGTGAAVAAFTSQMASGEPFPGASGAPTSDSEWAMFGLRAFVILIGLISDLIAGRPITPTRESDSWTPENWRPK